MGVDEIRYWMTALRKEHGWGTRVLSRTLGFRNGSAPTQKCKGHWIWRSEQRRASRQIERILSGELVCIRGRVGRGNAGKAIIAADPVPLTPPRHWVYDLKSGRLRLVPREQPKPLKVPA